MKKIYWASIFLFCVVTHLFSKSVMYACPWPDPEFSVLSLKPVNMLRVTERPYQKVHGHKKKSLDVPFSVIDHSDGKYVYLKNESSTGAVIDHMDSKKRPMRYKYRYLYVGRYGLLAPASDGKPMKFETEVRYVQDIDPITQKEGTFVVGYDCKQKKSLYEKHFLVPTHTFKEPILDDIPFSFEKPWLTVLDDASVTCTYPHKQSKKSKQHTTRDPLVFRSVQSSVPASQVCVVEKKNKLVCTS